MSYSSDKQLTVGDCARQIYAHTVTIIILRIIAYNFPHFLFILTFYFFWHFYSRGGLGPLGPPLATPLRTMRHYEKQARLTNKG